MEPWIYPAAEPGALGALKIYFLHMFRNTIDSKSTYNDADGYEVIDLGKSIFGNQVDRNIVYSIYRVPAEMEMRPDLVSNAMYGSSEYAEMVMKYSGISNPFAISEGDVVMLPSMSTVYNDVASDLLENYETADKTDLVKKYHKYIDPEKKPATAGSEVNSTEIAKGSANNTAGTASMSRQGSSSGRPAGNEANISQKGSSGISIINGRIYFGDTVSANTFDVTDIDGTNLRDSSVVDCAREGVTLGQFLNATITNRRNLK